MAAKINNTNALRHGMAGTPTYRSWESMKYRVKVDFNGYGKHKICKRWWLFANFLEDMGERPADHTLDRVDGTKGYSLKNCRWADWKTQNSNRKSTVWVTVNGITDHVAGWSKRIGLSTYCIHRRLRRGLTHEEAVNKARQKPGPKTEQIP